jgi:AraC-like DNA-binding protein
MDALSLGLLDEFERTLGFRYHSGGVSEVPPGYSTGWRTLPFACCAQTTYSSSIHVMGQRLELSPNEACVIGQGVRHRIDQEGGQSGISRFAHVNFEMFGCIDVLSLFEVPVVHRSMAADRIGLLCAELAAIADGHDSGPQAVIRRKSLGLELLRTISDASALSAKGPAQLETFGRLRPVYEYIQMHLADRITLGALARIAHLSPSRFHAVFKSMSGQAPQRFVQRLRMLKAQQLLIETDMTVKEIAANVGHPDEFHFSRSFKQQCGASPVHYRRMARSMMFGPQQAEER